MPKGIYIRIKPVWNKGLIGYRAGVHHTEETKRKISQSHIGIRHTEETKKRLSLFFKGKPMKEETKQKIKETMRKRFVPLTIEEMDRREDLRKIRSSLEYQKWKEAVLIRDGFMCIKCGEDSVSKLTVDHIKSLNWFPQLATEISNGRVLCSLCHLKEKTHGSGSKIPIAITVDI